MPQPPPPPFNLQIFLTSREEAKKSINLEQIGKFAFSGLETSRLRTWLFREQRFILLAGDAKKPVERSGHQGYLVPKGLMNICSQLSPPPLPLQLHETRRRAWPDEATSVCKTHPRHGHCQLPPGDRPRPLPEGCDLRPPEGAVHFHLTGPKTSRIQTSSPICHTEGARATQLGGTGLFWKTAGPGAREMGVTGGPSSHRTQEAWRGDRLRAPRDQGSYSPARSEEGRDLTPATAPLRGKPPAEKPRDERPSGQSHHSRRSGARFSPWEPPRGLARTRPPPRPVERTLSRGPRKANKRPGRAGLVSAA